MGCYGIGPARILAAAIEQRADEKGIVWPRGDRALGGRRSSRSARQGEETLEAAERSTSELSSAGYRRAPRRPRQAGPGEKLTDAELLGCPLRIVVGKRGARRGRGRGAAAGQRRADALPVDGWPRASMRCWHGLMAARGPLAAAWRSRRWRSAVTGRAARRAPAVRDRPLGPRPAADQRRAAASPVHAAEPRRLPAPGARSRSSWCSRSSPATAARHPATLLYLWITLGDLLDGFLARATGQYSRMGALLDPIVDRLSAPRRRRRLLALRAAAALGDRPARRPRGGDAVPRRVRAAARRRHRGHLDRPDRDPARLRRNLLVDGLRLVDHPSAVSSPASRSGSPRPYVYVRGRTSPCRQRVNLNSLTFPDRGL